MFLRPNSELVRISFRFYFYFTKCFSSLIARLPEHTSLAALIIAVDNADQLETRFHDDCVLERKWRDSDDFVSDFRVAKKIASSLFDHVRSDEFDSVYKKVAVDCVTLSTALQKSLPEDTVDVTDICFHFRIDV